jgi:3'-5' exoribonuclease
MTTAPNHGAQAARKYLRDLGQPPQNVSGTFAIINKQLGTTRDGKYYLKCMIGDKSAQITARMWTIDEATYCALPTDGFVRLEGQTQTYQGESQLIISHIEPAEPAPEQVRELLPASVRSPEEMFADLVRLLETLEHPAMKALAKAYLGDTMLMDKFRQAPAAKAMHHAYLGGLLEHTLTLLHLAELICPLYPGINRDIVLLGLFLHDLAKTRELVYDRAFCYTDRGELVGHIVDGVILLHDKVHAVLRQGIRIPAPALLALEHIILSHHGVPEFGAAKIPSTPEAILVSLIDNLDAKTTMALAAAGSRGRASREPGVNFTERHWALDTKIYKPDPLA